MVDCLLLLLRRIMLFCTIIIVIIIFLCLYRVPNTILITIIIIITNFKRLHFHIEYILPQLINNLLFILYLILQRQYIGP